MATITNGSVNIAILDFKTTSDLCAGIFYTDLSLSTYIGTGYDNILGASLRVTNPSGVIIKEIPTSGYDIYSPLTDDIEVDIPTTAGNYQYGSYTFHLELTDADGEVYTISKTVSICHPDLNNKTRNYGTLSAKLEGNCVNGKLSVQADSVPTYKGVIATSQVNDFTLTYPTSSGIAVLSTTGGSFSATLFEGVYKFAGTVCATYYIGDGVYVKVNYKLKKEKNVRCMIDWVCIAAQLEAMHREYDTNCTDKEKQATQDKIITTLRLIKTIEVLTNAGFDAGDYIDELESLLGCVCTCNCAEGTPIINVSPANDVLISGCNVTKETVGLTDTYAIENYTYVVAVTANGGAITVSSPILNDCTQTQTITFNIGTVYTQIKNQIDDATEYDAWAAFIRSALAGLDTSCLDGETTTLLQLMQAMVNKACSGGECDATISGNSVARDVGDVIISWINSSSDDVHEVAVYMDNILVGTVLHPLQSFTIEGAADGEAHIYELVPKCTNGSVGTSLTGIFTETNPTYVSTFRLGASLISSGSLHPESPAYNSGTGAVTSVSDSVINIEINLPYYAGSDSTNVEESYTFPAGLIVDSSVVVGTTWNINAHYNGTTNNTFVITAPALSVFSYTNEAYAPLANSKMTPGGDSFEGVEGTGYVYSSENPATIVFRIPYRNLGGTPDFTSNHILPAGLVIDNAVVDGTEWVVNAHYDGAVPHTFNIHLPVYVNVFQLDGAGINNANVQILTGGIYWEAANDPPYNLGYGGFPTASVSLKFTGVFVVDTGVFATDYFLPAAVTVVSSPISGGYYVVTITYPHTMNRINNFQTNLS